MAKREEKGGTQNFSRGAELWMHQTRLLMVAVWTVFLIALVLGLLVAVAYFWNASDELHRYALQRNVLGHVRETLHMTAGKMELHVNGKFLNLEVSQVIRLTQELADEGLRHAKNGLLIGGLSGAGIFFLISIYWWGYGRSKMEDQQIRGAELVTGKELKSIIEERNEASPYVIAGVPMRKGSENLNMLISGAQGTGKSQQFFAMMRQVRARGMRMIVYDPTGEYTAAFYREGKDVLMNPLDQRSPNWNIWGEIEKDYHFDNTANGLIPDPAEADPFWSLAGRMVLKDVYRVLGQENKRTNKELYNAIAKSNLDSMHAMLQGTAGATYVDPKTERTGMSLKMTVQNQLEAFRFLPDVGTPFSIRKWVHTESDSWMFISARESMREALKPVLSLWIDTVIKAVLDLKPIHRERLWLSLDELPTLQKLDVLKLALTNGRKYGLCVMLGVQDFSQLKEIYGEDLASTIISGCQTKLLLRVTDGEAAKLLAELIGESEIDEKDETVSYGLNSQRDGVSVSSRRQIRDLVLTSEILKLDDLAGYLTVPGAYPVAKVKYDYVPSEVRAEGFIEREGFSVYFSAKGEPPTSESITSENRTDQAGAGEGKPAVSGSGKPGLLDDDMDVKAKTDDEQPGGVVSEVVVNAAGDVVDSVTGEVLPKAIPFSRAKLRSVPDHTSQSKPLAGAL